MTVLTNTMLQGTSADTGEESYEIKHSIRFEEDDLSYIRRRHEGEHNRQSWTYSGWYKFSGNFNDEEQLFNLGGQCYMRLNTDNTILASWGSVYKTTTDVFRDQNAWYHIVWTADSNNPLDFQRHRLYVNGKRITLQGGNGWPSQAAVDNDTSLDLRPTIGVQGWNNSHYSNFLCADPQWIDGLVLGPASFGYHDSAGVWQPKTFYRPNPNNGTKWSDQTWKYVSDNSTVSWSGALSKAFKGFLSGNNAYASSPNSDYYWEPSVDLPLTSTFSIWCDYNYLGNKPIEVHTDGGVAYTYAYSNGWASGSWTGSHARIDCKVPAGSTKLTKLVIPQTSFDLQGFEVDGILLTDEAKDPSTRVNPNDGTTWSGNLTVSSGSITDAAKAFNGNDTQYAESGSNGEKLIWTPSTPMSFTRLEVLQNQAQGNSQVRWQNNADDSWSSWIVDIGGWQTLTNSGGVVKAIETERTNNSKAQLWGIKIDGHTLIDTTYDHSFHLKFEDTTTQKALGISSLAQLANIPPEAGAILKVKNTDSSVLDSGVNVDLDSSHIVLAIAGNTIADHSHTIKGSGSAKTLTANGGATTSTTQSKFYGTSMYFDGTNDYIDTNQFTAGDKFCIECWFYYDGDALDGCRPFNGSEDLDGSDYLYMEIQANGKFKCRQEQLGILETPKQCLKPRTWHHIAFTYDANQTRLFVDGRNLVASAGNNNWTPMSDVRFRLGADESNANSGKFKGYIQDARVYFGTAKYLDDFTPAGEFDIYNIVNKTEDFQLAITGNESSSIALNNPERGWNGKIDEFIDANGDVLSSYAMARVEGNWPNNNNIYITPSTAIATSSNSNNFTLYMSVHNATNETYSFIVSYTDGSTYSSGNLSSNSTYIIKHTISTAGKSISQIEGVGPGINFGGIRLENGKTTFHRFTDLDVLTDTPTNYGTDTGAGGEVRGNYCVLNSLARKEAQPNERTLSDGNLQMKTTTSGSGLSVGTLGVNKGKWYFEATVLDYSTDGSATAPHPMIGWAGHGWEEAGAGNLGYGGYSYAYKGNNGNKVYNSEAGTGYGNAWNSVGTTVGCAFDADNGVMWFHNAGTWQDDATKAEIEAGTTTNAAWSNVNMTVDGGWYFPAISDYNTANTTTMAVNFGQQPWRYPNSVPSGYKAICTQNLDDTFSGDQVNDPSYYFDILHRIGGGSNGIQVKGLKFQPDLLWDKVRTADGAHNVFDAIRGNQKYIQPDKPNAEATSTDYFASFNSDGITFDSGDWSSTNKIVDWCWDAGATAATASTEGSVTPTAQWVNNTAGFSITQYEGTGSATTVGHGLSVKPTLLIWKNLDSSAGWRYWQNGLQSAQYMELDTTAAKVSNDTGVMNNNYPTNTLFHIGGSNETNKNGDTIMCYAFADIPGYSRFAMYYGNSNADGPFVHCGFQPHFVFIKDMETTWDSIIFDTERSPQNPNNLQLWPYAYSGGGTYDAGSGGPFPIDIVSNGFKCRTNDGDVNNDGHKMLFWAFAEQPFKTARAR